MYFRVTNPSNWTPVHKLMFSLLFLFFSFGLCCWELSAEQVHTVPQNAAVLAETNPLQQSHERKVSHLFPVRLSGFLFRIQEMLLLRYSTSEALWQAASGHWYHSYYFETKYLPRRKIPANPVLTWIDFHRGYKVQLKLDWNLHDLRWW